MLVKVTNWNQERFDRISLLTFWKGSDSQILESDPIVNFIIRILVNILNH